jgi:arylsulfatase
MNIANRQQRIIIQALFSQKSGNELFILRVASPWSTFPREFAPFGLESSMARLLFGCLFFACLLVPVSAAESLKGTRPNIILVMTDDQGMGDLSCLGNPVLKTPNLDRFYGLSTRFTEFHVSPTCAPTRSAIFSGRHEFRNGVTHTIKERERMALSTTTFVKLLHQNGYETGIFGKWHLGDEDEYQPYNRGFSKTFIHGAGGIGQSYEGSCADFPPNRTNKYFDCVILNDDTIVQTKGFCTDVFFTAALGWTKQQLDAKTPFFTYLTLNAPHGPMIAPDKYKQRFLDLGYDQNTAGRYGMIENIDDNFGLLMQKLDEWQAWENTLVIFMTDNGQAGRRAKLNGKNTPLFTAGFKTGKGSPYEGGTHVPAFWRWKGVLGEGVDINALTAHIDLYKTFCELAAVEIPAGIQQIDGRSMLPLLENPQAAWDDRYLFVHQGRWAKGADPNESKFKNCAVRTQRWRLVNDKDLYDISKDPYEKVNVIDDHPQVVADLRAAYDKWWAETVPLMVNENAPYAPQQPQAVRYEKQKAEQGIPNWTPPSL